MNLEPRHSAFLTKGTPATTGKRTYVVMGAMRGGTSMVGGVMRGLGIHMGNNIQDNNHECKDFANRPVPHMLQAVKDNSKDHDVWGWKFPNAANYLDRLFGKLKRPHLICVFRDVVSNGSGINRWHPFGEMQAVQTAALQQQKNLNMIALRGCPSILISYEKAVRHPEQFVTEFSDLLGYKPDHDAFDFESFMAPGSYKSFDEFSKK